MRHNFLPPFFFAIFALFSASSHAESASPWQRESEVAVRLISATEAVGTGPVALGLEIKLEPGWKTYWRLPGAAGLPLAIDWAGSSNLKSAEVQWPAPARHEYAGLTTFGYAGHVTLPIQAEVQDASQPLTVSAKADLMVCSDLCIPYTFNFSLNLPAGEASPSFYGSEIELWQSRVPSATTAQGLEITSAELNDGQLRVHVKATPPLTPTAELLVEAPGNPLFSPPTASANDPNQLTAKLVGSMGNKGLQNGSLLRFTLIDGTRLLDQTVPLQTSSAAASATTAPTLLGLMEMLVVAFIGGMILNLMPCVLPVLSIKLLALMQHAGAPPRHVRMSFLASALGIMASFIVLAGIMITMKLAGMQVGWGMQFQEPWFLIFIIAILGLFAATLWDFIHIPLPRFMMDAVNDRLPQPGESDHTLLGNFLTGAFATLLATPCSAPFVGTAAGFALGGSPLSIALIFLAMGLGLATPYLLVAAFPRLARFLPRPGRWMNTLRAVLGFALLGTALWLVSVLQAEWGSKAAHVGGGLLTILFILWIRHSIEQPRMLIKGAVAIAVALAVGLYVPPLLAGPPSGIAWQKFDEAAIPRLVSSGKIVLVDVTADWCLTCKVNERMVLNQPDVTALLNQPNVVAMRADFTNKDDAIFAYLRKFQRFGIPFNAVYTPGAKEILLPELLSVNALKQLLAPPEEKP